MNSYTANFSEFSIKVLTVNLIRLTWKSIKSKCRYIGILSTNACRSSWRWRQTGWGNYNKKNRYTKKWNISDVTEEYFCYQIWHEIWSSAGVKNTQISPAKVGHQSPRNTSNQDILHYCNTPKLLLRLQGLKPLSFFLKNTQIWRPSKWLFYENIGSLELLMATVLTVVCLTLYLLAESWATCWFPIRLLSSLSLELPFILVFRKMKMKDKNYGSKMDNLKE